MLGLYSMRREKSLSGSSSTSKSPTEQRKRPTRHWSNASTIQMKFIASDSERGKQVVIQLAKDAGFADCYNIGGNDKFELMEQFAWFWINLAMFQGQGREIGFKLMKR